MSYYYIFSFLGTCTFHFVCNLTCDVSNLTSDVSNRCELDIYILTSRGQITYFSLNANAVNEIPGTMCICTIILNYSACKQNMYGLYQYLAKNVLRTAIILTHSVRNVPGQNEKVYVSSQDALCWHLSRS